MTVATPSNMTYHVVLNLNKNVNSNVKNEVQVS